MALTPLSPPLAKPASPTAAFPLCIHQGQQSKPASRSAPAILTKDLNKQQLQSSHDSHKQLAHQATTASVSLHPPTLTLYHFSLVLHCCTAYYYNNHCERGKKLAQSEQRTHSMHTISSITANPPLTFFCQLLIKKRGRGVTGLCYTTVGMLSRVNSKSKI